MTASSSSGILPIDFGPCAGAPPPAQISRAGDRKTTEQFAILWALAGCVYLASQLPQP
jgi:hypothetical protein